MFENSEDNIAWKKKTKLGIRDSELVIHKTQTKV